jgi:hypothetical protein
VPPVRTGEASIGGRFIVSVIVFITLGGIVVAPDGSAATPAGGRAFRHGPECLPAQRRGAAVLARSWRAAR